MRRAAMEPPVDAPQRGASAPERRAGAGHAAVPCSRCAVCAGCAQRSLPDTTAPFAAGAAPCTPHPSDPRTRAP